MLDRDEAGPHVDGDELRLAHQGVAEAGAAARDRAHDVAGVQREVALPGADRLLGALQARLVERLARVPPGARLIPRGADRVLLARRRGQAAAEPGRGEFGA